jgi:outer membrane protein
MKKSAQYLILICTVILYRPAEAQTTDTTKWNLQDCFRYATEHNIQVSTLRLDELYAQQNLYLSKGAKIPSLYGTVGNTFNNANNDATGNGHLVNQLNSTGTYAVNSSIVLWNSNYINNDILQNNLLVQSAGLSTKQSVNTITLSISQAYLNILLAKENLTYVTDLAGTSSAQVKQGQLFYDAGSVAKINLLQLQAQFASDKYLLIQTQNTIKQNVLLLKQLLQLPSDTLFDIVTPDSVAVLEILPSLKTVQQHAIENFPEIKIGKLGIDIASLDIAKARAGFKPVLSATGAIGSGYSDVITNSTLYKTGYFTQSGNNFYQRVGLTLSVPIFSNRINSTNLAKANIGYRQASLNLQNYQLVLSQAVEQVYLNTSNAMQAYTASNEQLVAARESFRIINEQFKLGGTNTFEVLQLRNQYIQAVQAYTQAKYTAVLQYKIYEFYLGNPVTF